MGFSPFSERYFLKRYQEDTPVDLNQAKKAISRAWILSAAGIAVEIWFEWNPLGKLLEKSPFFQKEIIRIIISALTFRLFDGMYLFPPWMFPGILSVFGLLIVSFLTFMVYKKNRIAAVSLFIFYFLIKAFMLIWLFEFSMLFITLWLCVSLLWGFIFFQGCRGTFTYYGLKNKL